MIHTDSDVCIYIICICTHRLDWHIHLELKYHMFLSKPLCNELQAQNTMAQLQAVAAVFQDTNEIRLEDPLDQTPKVETSKVQPARHEFERNCHSSIFFWTFDLAAGVSMA